MKKKKPAPQTKKIIKHLRGDMKTFEKEEEEDEELIKELKKEKSHGKKKRK